jgi:hypothetical protein
MPGALILAQKLAQMCDVLAKRLHRTKLYLIEGRSENWVYAVCSDMSLRPWQFIWQGVTCWGPLSPNPSNDANEVWHKPQEGFTLREKLASREQRAERAIRRKESGAPSPYPLPGQGERLRAERGK